MEIDVSVRNLVNFPKKIRHEVIEGKSWKLDNMEFGSVVATVGQSMHGCKTSVGGKGYMAVEGE